MKSIALLPLLLAALLPAADDYPLGPDSLPHPGVPKGKVTKYTFDHSRIFPGTTRNYWVYVPAQYDAARPACVMIFQDGAGFVGETGAWRAPIVLDNLIQQSAMPVTIGIFIDPGVRPADSPNQMARFNRSYEYDGLGDRYARFLIEEILPESVRSTNSRPTPTTAGSAVPVPVASRPSLPHGSGPTPFAASSASSVVLPTCAAAISTPV